MIATNSDFIIAEQQGRRGYIQHVFSDKDQFLAWRARNPQVMAIERTCARGRSLGAADHRNEFDLRLRGEVNSRTIALAIQALGKLHPQVIENANGRIERAIDILSNRDIAEVTPTVFLVQAQTDESISYRVDIAEKSCTCPDSARGNICKHRVAVWLYRKIVEG